MSLKDNFSKISPILLLFLFLFYFIPFQTITSEIKFKPKSHTCEPFNHSAKNFHVSIDGVKYPSLLPLNLNKTINFQCLNSNPRVYKILFWTPFFGNAEFAFGLGLKKPFIDNECPVYNCETFNDKSRIAEADMVIVHMRNNIKKIPTKRPKGQRWVFAVYESPMHCPDFTNYNNLFNFTSTYRTDSEFSRLTGSYQKFVWGKNETFDPNRDFSAGKSNLAAAVIGNCGGSSGRFEFIKRLQKFIPITVFGKCGIKCTDFFNNSTNSQCKELIGKSHKFYFAFENSICNGYISEKFFGILRYDIIPVVLGGGNYSFFVPKSGFINVLDFSGPQELANYLLYLDRNKTAYNSYFRWKQYALFKDRLVFSNFCDMCIQLNLERYVPIWRNSWKNIGAHWSKKANCKKYRFANNGSFYLVNY